MRIIHNEHGKPCMEEDLGLGVREVRLMGSNLVHRRHSARCLRCINSRFYPCIDNDGSDCCCPDYDDEAPIPPAFDEEDEE